MHILERICANWNIIQNVIFQKECGVLRNVYNVAGLLQFSNVKCTLTHPTWHNTRRPTYCPAPAFRYIHLSRAHSHAHTLSDTTTHALHSCRDGSLGLFPKTTSVLMYICDMHKCGGCYWNLLFFFCLFSKSLLNISQLCFTGNVQNITSQGV